ncbi:MAG: histidine--tRNA ligase [Acidimicrobiales bacterium]
MASSDHGPPSGTRDFLAPEVARRRWVFDQVRTVFERYGFVPLETPAMERLEVLTGKYGDEGDKLVFKILKRGVHEATGEADLALRYDLTVPLARVVARHLGQLGVPYKRYQMGPVWRADRPGRGRFREFHQCDIDVVGSPSPVADAEVILALVDALFALGLPGVSVELNSRNALRGLIQAYGVPPELEVSALIALDKLDKIGPAGVVAELAERGVPEGALGPLRSDLEAPDREARTAELADRTEVGRRGRHEIEQVRALVEPRLEQGRGRIAVSPFLARGLDYYTGPIFELTAPGSRSSIGSGGRYDQLMGQFSGRDVPATGGSLGIERVLLLLGPDLGQAPVQPDVWVATVEGSVEEALALVVELRRAGLIAELSHEGGALGRQLKAASARGARLCVIEGPEERASGTVTVKDLDGGTQQPVARAELVSHLLARSR